MTRFLSPSPYISVALAAVGCLLGDVTGRAQTPPPVATSPVIVDRNIASYLVRSQIKPEYPVVARVNYIQGRVRMEVVVTTEGRVKEAHVVHGHPFLAVSALQAVRRWIYRPFVTKSGPAAFLTVIDMNFTLHTKKLEQLPDAAERDLYRQVRPPEVVDRPLGQPSACSVRMRILVGDKGQVVDWHPVAGSASQFGVARKSLEHWTFRPAHWGALAVPWYLDVDVPIEDSTLHRPAADPGGQ